MGRQGSLYREMIHSPSALLSVLGLKFLPKQFPAERTVRVFVITC